MADFSQQFFSVKINAGISPGAEIARKFNIQGVPQMVFINKDEEEMDRIIGFLSPEDFIPRVQDILDNKNTVPDLKAKLEKDPDNREVLQMLAGKYEEMGNSREAKELYTKLLEAYPDDKSEDINHARYYLALDKFYNGDNASIQKFIMEFPDSRYVYDAYLAVSRYYSAVKDTTNEIRVLSEWAEKFPDDAGALNAYAWRMSEFNTNLEDALKKAKHAVELLKDDPSAQANVIDTEAELLWKLGRIEEAVASIEKAIAIDPEYQYFKDQKSKFLGSDS